MLFDQQLLSLEDVERIMEETQEGIEKQQVRCNIIVFAFGFVIYVNVLHMLLFPNHLLHFFYIEMKSAS